MPDRRCCGLQERFLLIAIFSFSPDRARRSLVRDTWLQYDQRSGTASGLLTDHLFVLGNWSEGTAGHADVLLSEQRVHRDLLVVPCTENCMDSGKILLTLQYLSALVRRSACLNEQAWRDGELSNDAGPCDLTLLNLALGRALVFRSSEAS